MKIERYAAIDIGSNAVRVLISNVVVSPGTQPKYMKSCLLYTSPSPRDRTRSRMPSSA